MRLHRFAVLSFDCYGTLIDWEAGIWEALRPAFEQAGRTGEKNQVLEAFGRAESDLQAVSPGMPYPEVLANVYRRLAEEFGLEQSDRAARAFGASITHWPAFPDSPAALAYLKQHYALAILSNVDRASFATSNQKLGVTFDVICTAEEIGSYKPDPRNFHYMLERLGERGFTHAQILHTAESLYHDHVPAKRLGLATCWIHRRHAQDGCGATRAPEVAVSPDFRFESLAALADAHRAELAGRAG